MLTMFPPCLNLFSSLVKILSVNSVVGLVPQFWSIFPKNWSVRMCPTSEGMWQGTGVSIHLRPNLNNIRHLERVASGLRELVWSSLVYFQVEYCLFYSQHPKTWERGQIVTKFTTRCNISHSVQQILIVLQPSIPQLRNAVTNLIKQSQYFCEIKD